MVNKSFSFGEALGFGWSVMKSNFWFFAGLLIVSAAISLLPNIIEQTIKNLPYTALLLYPAVIVIEVVISIGIIKIALGFCNGTNPRFGTLFDGWDCFWSYLGTGILYSLIIMAAAAAFFLVPRLLISLTGICHFDLPLLIAAFIMTVILSIKFSLSFYFVIDKGLGPINALRASSRATEPVKLRLFFFFILCGLINLLGMLCLIVGIFATAPTILVAMALVYRDLAAQTPELASLGITSPDSHDDYGVDIEPGIQSGLAIRLSSPIRPEPVIAPAPISPQPAEPVQSETEDKNSSFLSKLLLFGIIIAIAGGTIYYFWSQKKLRALSRHLPIQGILYSEDDPAVLIDGEVVKQGDIVNGVRVVKIYTDRVECEKDGKWWTQKTNTALAPP